MDSQSSSLFDMIPQVSYDLIGRILPGMFVTLEWLMVYFVPGVAFKDIAPLFTPTFKLPELPLSLFLLLAVWSYFIAIILFGLAEVIRRLGKAQTALFKRDAAKKSHPESMIYDMIRIKSPATGARLVKLHAEADSGRVIISGTLIALLLNAFYMLRYAQADRWVMEVILLVILIGVASFVNYVEKRTQTSLHNHQQILFGMRDHAKNGTRLRQIGMFWQARKNALPQTHSPRRLKPSRR